MRIVATGIGLVTGLGGDCQTNWNHLLEGKSGIGGANFNSAAVLWNPAEKFYGLPKVEGFLKKAVDEALADAFLSLPLRDCGMVVGSSRGYQAEFEFVKNQVKNLDKVQVKNHNWLNLFSLSGAIAAYIETKNQVLAPMAACATANWAIFQACNLIRHGFCDLVIAAASDSAITPLTLAGFQKLGVLAKTGLYPFSREREGMLLGEGAAVLILESQESAEKRSAKIYGEILGVGITNDAFHPTNFSPKDDQKIIGINSCLGQSGLLVPDIDFISAHGTGTRSNDSMESALIQKIFKHNPRIIATKGATGHALGATGMMEAAFCLLALHHQILPPCVGMRTPDFDLNFVRETTKASVKTALSFSFGFGGQNSVVAFGKF